MVIFGSAKVNGYDSEKIGSTWALIMLLLFRKSDSAKEGNAINLLQKVMQPLDIMVR
jgi:hypothetical protein